MLGLTFRRAQVSAQLVLSKPSIPACSIFLGFLVFLCLLSLFSHLLWFVSAHAHNPLCVWGSGFGVESSRGEIGQAFGGFEFVRMLPPSALCCCRSGLLCGPLHCLRCDQLRDIVQRIMSVALPIKAPALGQGLIWPAVCDSRTRRGFFFIYEVSELCPRCWPPPLMFMADAMS